MNILFIGPYRQHDEWGSKSRSMLNALQNTKHTITSRPIYLSNNYSVDTSVVASELTVSNTYDVVIQFVLQPYAVRIGTIPKNIGIFNYETISNNLPIDLLSAENLMDEVWTESSTIKESLETLFKNNNINTKVTQIPLTLNIEELPKHQEVLKSPQLENRFIFYCMCDLLNEEDEFKKICMAYFNTFTQQDMVALVAFSSTYIEDQKVQGILTEAKSLIGNSTSNQDQAIINITMPSPPAGKWTLQDRINMHNQGDAMISISPSMATKSTVLEAAIYQKTPIINNKNSAYDLLGKENVWGIESYNDVCISKNRSLKFRFTGKELWNVSNIESLGTTMMNCYINKLERDKKQLANGQLREKFINVDYEQILNERAV